jgi:hypothetical protein
MSIQNEPHYTISTEDVATWLERQGEDVWWTVALDRLLTGLRILPCTGPELAAEFRRLNRTILVLDPNKNPDAHGQLIGPGELDNLVSRFNDDVPAHVELGPGGRDRFFYCSWPGAEKEWMLMEDGDTTEAERRDAVELAAEKE